MGSRDGDGGDSNGGGGHGRMGIHRHNISHHPNLGWLLYQRPRPWFSHSKPSSNPFLLLHEMNIYVDVKIISVIQ